MKRNILFSLSLQLGINVLVDRGVLPRLFSDDFGDFVDYLGSVEAYFVAITDLLIAQGARILQSEDVLQARLVHMMVAIFELQTCLSVHYFRFTEGTVGLWNIEIALRWLENFLKSHGKESRQ